MSIVFSPGQREVEVKYRVADGGALIAALVEVGVRLGGVSRQDDQAYAPASWAYGGSKIGVPFARLRSEAGRVLFTVKVPRANELDCAEQETVVEDRAAMHEALLLMGFVPTVRIVKERRRGDWDGMSVCLDRVAGLGTFVELERIVAGDLPPSDGTTGSGVDVQSAMDQQVRALGVELARVTQTYDSLLREAGFPEGSSDLPPARP